MRAVGSRFSRDAVFASLVGAAVFGIYMVGATRPFNLDASVTVARYVATPSLLDPLRHQFVYNNHVFFSLANHVVYSVTGSRSEVVLRLLPVIAAAVALGVMAFVLASWTGRTAAAAATALAAWTPLMLANCREVRGYSFLLLSATLSSALFISIRRAPERRRAREVAYVASLAFGVATHAYAAAMILLHAAALGADRRALREWAPRWAAALVIGLLPLVGVAHEMLSAGGSRGRVFQPHFPLDLGRALLGGAAVPVVVTGALAAIGAIELLRHAAWARRVAVALVVVVGAVWLLAPRDLYPRFFVWLVPVVAACVAVAIQRRRWLLAAAIPLLVVQAIRLAPTLTEAELANRSAARITDQAVAHGRRVCTFGLSNLALEAYTTHVRELGPQLDGLDRCDVVVQVFTPVPSELTWPPQVAASFPRRLVLPAAHPGVVSARVPLQ
jgi:hypothetical protein